MICRLERDPLGLFLFGEYVLLAQDVNLHLPFLRNACFFIMRTQKKQEAAPILRPDAVQQWDRIKKKCKACEPAKPKFKEGMRRL